MSSIAGTTAATTSARGAAPRAWPPGIGLASYLALALALGGGWLEAEVAASLRPGRVLGLSEFVTPLWTIVIGALCSVSCSLLGCYLFLRRMSLLGDAISHAVLPGLAIAFLLTGRLSGTPIVVGAMAIGIVTSLLTQVISGWGKVSEDTSMGVVFTSLFALGVVLVMVFANRAHIDAECILYGQIEYAAVDYAVGDWLRMPYSIWSLGATLLATLAFVVALWKELKIVAFDPALAAAMGLSVPAIHYALMAMVAGASVASFEAVGSILVVAMLIVPAAAAALITDRLGWMLAWAAAIGAVSALFGYLAAASTATNTAGMMAVASGVQLAGAVMLAPRHGLVSRWWRNLSLAVRIAGEDVIGRLYRAEEAGTKNQLPASASPPLSVSPIILWLAQTRLRRQGQLATDLAGGLRLTETGRQAARSLVRAHRLWESYLDTHFDLPRDHLHDAAERMEHFLDPQLQAELADDLAGRAVDPHGKEIPPGECEESQKSEVDELAKPAH
jgi:ABC-type Mn2+/Zn2+ transport system permease subunit/Mn-dependent DtxR family transcriptional regulator